MADETKTLKEHVVAYINGQPFNNVLLLGILAAIAWLGHYGLTVAIPSHLKQIQEGYEKLETAHETERVRTLEVYDRWLGAKEKPAATAVVGP